MWVTFAHVKKKFWEHSLTWLPLCCFHAIYLRAFSLSPNAQSSWTFAESFFKKWADWKVTSFCSARRFLERQIEGHSTTNLTSIQPAPDSCWLHFFFFSGRRVRVGRPWQPENDKAPQSHWKLPTVKWLWLCLAAPLRWAGCSGFSEAWAFCRGGPAETAAEVCLQDQKASLFRLGFQSTSFYYILMTSLIFYS